jgi:hypothetical protein
MLFDCVAVVLLAKFCIYLVGRLKLRPLAPLGAKLDLAAAFRRTAKYYRLGASIEVKQVAVEEIATYNRS